MTSGPQPESMHPLGKLIKGEMDKRHWSTRDVAAKGGPPASTIGRLINPRVQLVRPPDDKTRALIQQALDISPTRWRKALAESLNLQDDGSPPSSDSIDVVVSSMQMLQPWAQAIIAEVVTKIVSGLVVAQTDGVVRAEEDPPGQVSDAEVLRLPRVARKQPAPKRQT